MATFRSPPHNRWPFVLEQGEPVVDPDWFDYFREISSAFMKGVSTTVPLAPITGGGTAGSLTIVNGLITAVVAPT